MRFFADLRDHRRLRAERNAWRDRAYGAIHDASELAQLTLALRKRIDVLEGRLPAGSVDGLRLAHALEQAEALLESERELHRSACAVVRRYVDVYGDLSEGAA